MSKHLSILLALAVLPLALSCSSAPTEVISREPVALVVLDPELATLQVGKSLTITAYAVDTTGRPQQNRQMFWASSNTGIATVTSSGLVRGVSPGSVEIAASAEGKSAVSRVTVIPRAVDRVTVSPDRGELMIGRTLDLTANVFDDENGRLNGRAVTWSSNAEQVATVSSSGRVTARGVGSATITATSEGKSGTAQITVRPVAVHRVVVTAPGTQLRPDETMQLSAQTFDESDNVLTGRSVSWSTSNSSVATVSGSGLVTARAPGSVTVTATSEGRSGSVTLTVQQQQAPPPQQPPPVATVTVTPSSATLDIGQSIDLAATLRAADGSVLSDRVVTWQSSNALVATVSSTGRVTAVSAGSATITATSEGRSGTSSITVRQPGPPPGPGPIVRVEITPSSATLSARTAETVQLRARAYDAQGNEITGNVVTWTTSNARVATVTSGGLVRAVSPGSAVITARISGVSGTADISVNNSR